MTTMISWVTVRVHGRRPGTCAGSEEELRSGSGAAGGARVVRMARPEGPGPVQGYGGGASLASLAPSIADARAAQGSPMGPGLPGQGGVSGYGATVPAPSSQLQGR